MLKTGGYLVPDGNFQRELLEVVKRHTQGTNSRATRLYKENGVYKLYARLDVSPIVEKIRMDAIGEDARLCPLDGNAGSDVGFPGQPSA